MTWLSNGIKQIPLSLPLFLLYCIVIMIFVQLRTGGLDIKGFPVFLRLRDKFLFNTLSLSQDSLLSNTLKIRTSVTTMLSGHGIVAESRYAADLLHGIQRPVLRRM